MCPVKQTTPGNRRGLFCGNFTSMSEKPKYTLTPREIEVLARTAKGQNRIQIAYALSRSKRTIDFHFCNIMRKMGVRSWYEALRIACVDGIINEGVIGTILKETK